MFKKIIANNLQKEKIVVPGMILLLVLLGYGLLIPWLGFYWDDWPFAWFLKFFGSSEFIEAFRPFRPFLGPIFTLTTSLFGGNPFTWQVIGLTTRLLLSLEFWFLLRLIWPTRKQDLAWVVFLFTIYPAYQQQWVALTHVNQELIPFLFLLSSFIVTIWLVRNNRQHMRFTVLAITLQAMGLFTTEYFFGLEILRFFFLLAVFAETIKDRKELLQKTSLSWLPYLIVWILNALWTYSYHKSTAYISYEVSLLSSSMLSPLALGNEIITTFSLASFTSWLGAFNIFSTIDGTTTQSIALIIFIISTAALFMGMRFLPIEKSETSSNSKDNWALWAMTIGIAAIFAGRLPSWAAGLPLKIQFDYDRFFISIMLGASLFIVGLATLVLKDGKRKIFILSMLIGISTAYQFSIANTYRRDWDNQQTFFWQLAWRIPALEKNTALLTYELPLKYVSDLQVTAPISWMYAPSLNNRELPYALLYIKSRINSAVLPSLQPDTPIKLEYRTVPFDGSTSNSVVIYKDADGCLRVLDSVYGNAETVPGASYFLLNAIPLSNLDRIQVDAPAPVLDKTLFGEEPAHNWCYFYEKAELARQQADWEQVVKLYNQAQKFNLSPSMSVENLPFIEGFALTGDVDTALKLTERTLKTQKEICPAIYSLWNRVLQSSSARALNAEEINKRILQSGCKP